MKIDLDQLQSRWFRSKGLLFGALISLVTQGLTAIVLSVVHSASTVGQYYSVQQVSLLLSTISTLKIDNLILASKTQLGRNRLFNTSIQISIHFLTVNLLVALILSLSITTSLGAYYAIVIGGTVSTGLVLLGISFANSQADYQSLAWLRSSNAVASAFMITAATLVTNNILIWILAEAIGKLLCFIIFLHRIKHSIVFATVRTLRRQLLINWKLTLGGVSSTFVSTFASSLPIWLLGLTLGMESVGVWGLLNRIFAPIPSIFAQVIGPVFVNQFRDSRNRLNIYWKFFKYLALLSSITSISLSIVIIATVPLLLTKWVIDPLLVLACGASIIFSSCASTLSSIIVILKRQSAWLVMTVFDVIWRAGNYFIIDLIVPKVYVLHCYMLVLNLVPIVSLVFFERMSRTGNGHD